MVGLYGQILPVTGWTATAFESIGDDDPADHELRFDATVFDDGSLDPDLLENDYCSISPWLHTDDVVWVVPGRFSGIRREDLYEYNGIQTDSS